MSKRKREKPTIKEITQAIIQIQPTQSSIIDWMKKLQERVELIDNTFGAFISMEGIHDKLSKFIESEIKKKEKEKL